MADNKFGDFSEELDNFKNLAGYTKQIFDNLSKVKAKTSETGNIAKTVGNTYSSIAQELQAGLNSTKDLERVNKKIRDLKKQQVRIDVERAVLMDKVKTANNSVKKSIIKQLEALIDIEGNLTSSEELTSRMSSHFVNMKKNSNFFLQFAKSLRNIPGLGPLISKPLERAAEVAATRGKLAGGLTLLKEVGALFSTATIAKSILEASKQSKELSNSLGVGLAAANGIQKEFTTFANQTSDARLTTQGLVEAQIKLQQNLKLGTQFSGETLQNFIQLTEYLGVSEKAASRIALAQESIGDKSGEFTNNLAESAVLSAKNLGINLSLQEVYESIGSLTTTTLINLRRNPEALGQALAEAKKLGVELDSIRGISESLLNFEQSIQSELEAEVLTGRQLNFERARLASLKGDDLALTREIANQVGTISEFEQMNVLQRQSLSKAFGMNVEQMGEMLLRQEAILANEGIATRLTKEQLQAARDRVETAGSLGAALKEVATEADATKNFENAAKQLQQAFQQIVLKVTPLVTSISKLLANLLASPFGKLAVGLAGGAALVMKALSTFRPTGLTPSTPMYTSEVGTGGGLENILGGNRYGVKMRASQMGKYGLSRRFGGAMGMKGVGLGAAAGLLGIGVGSLADQAGIAGKEGLAVGLDTASGALSGAGTGAMIGSVIPVIGTGVGAAIGALVGGVTAHMDAAEKRREEADRKRQEEFQNALREVAMQEARIYMDKHEVGRTIATGNIA